MKDLTAFEEKHDIAYSSVCAAADYNADYIGECARRLNERESITLVKIETSTRLKTRWNVGMIQYPKIVISKLLQRVLETTLIKGT